MRSRTRQALLTAANSSWKLTASFRPSNSAVAGWRSWRTAAVLAKGSSPATLATALCACGPLIRMIEIAAGGCPLDKANMVSRLLIGDA